MLSRNKTARYGNINCVFFPLVRYNYRRLHVKGSGIGIVYRQKERKNMTHLTYALPSQRKKKSLKFRKYKKNRD